MAAPVDLWRRRLLTGKDAAALAPPRPPWSVAEARFTAACTRCGACVAACPEGILITGDGGFPAVAFHRGGCTFCGACADACREPGLFSRAGPPWPWRASLGAGCFAAAGVVCQSCGDVCGAGAIRFRPALRRPPHPVLDVAVCTGCGACVAACPAGAVTLHAGDADA